MLNGITEFQSHSNLKQLNSIILYKNQNYVIISKKQLECTIASIQVKIEQSAVHTPHPMFKLHHFQAPMQQNPFCENLSLMFNVHVTKKGTAFLMRTIFWNGSLSPSAFSPLFFAIYLLLLHCLWTISSANFHANDIMYTTNL